MPDFTASLPGLFLLVVVIVLALAAILMPLYVIHMSSQIDKIRLALEKLVWHAEQREKREQERDARRY